MQIKNFGIRDIESVCENTTRRMKTAHYTLLDSTCAQAKKELRNLRINCKKFGDDDAKILESGCS